MLTQASFPPDIRIEKEASFFAKRGDEVFVCACTSKSSSVQTQNAFKVISFDETFSPVITSVGRLRRILKTIRPEILHIHDTPRSLRGYLAAEGLGIPVVFDIHELWPSLVLDNFADLSYREVLWSERLRAEEAFACFKASAVLGVVEEARDYFLQKYHFLADRIFPIRNFEDVQGFEKVRPSSELMDIEALKVVYVGGIDGPIRGLEDVIAAFSLLSSEEAKLLVVGSGRHLSRLMLLARQLNVIDKVSFIGQRSFHDAMEIVASSDICLVPHRKCIATEHTLPHKISQYMALNKPVISTSLKPIKRLFDSAFIEWEPHTPQKLANLILSTKGSEDYVRAMTKRAYKLVSERYQWKKEGANLAKVYERLAPR